MECECILRGVFIFLVILLGHSCHGLEECYAKEGTTYECICNETTKGGGILYWEMNGRNSSTELSNCDDLSAENRECNNNDPEHFKAWITSEDKGQTYISTLQILNVTTDLRDKEFECAVIYLMLEKAWVEMKCSLVVYYPPESPLCHSQIIEGKGVVVTCKTAKVYPDMVCKLFQRQVDHEGVDIVGSERQMELDAIHYDVTSLSGDPIYYSVSCTAEIDSEQPENYRFRAEIYPNVSDSAKAAGIKLDVIPLPKVPSTKDSSMTHIYVLVGVILVVLVSVIILGSYVLWKEHPDCLMFSFLNRPNNSREEEGNNYETISCLVGPGEPARGDEPAEPYDNNQDQRVPLAQGEGGDAANGYINQEDNPPNILPLPPPRPHRRNEYIEPTTPTMLAGALGCRSASAVPYTPESTEDEESEDEFESSETGSNQNENTVPKVIGAANVDSATSPNQTHPEDSEDTAVKCPESGAFTDRGYESLSTVDPQESESRPISIASRPINNRDRNVAGPSSASGHSTDQGYRSAYTTSYNSEGASNMVDPNSVTANVVGLRLAIRERANSENDKVDKDDPRSTEDEETPVSRVLE